MGMRKGTAHAYHNVAIPHHPLRKGTAHAYHNVAIPHHPFRRRSNAQHGPETGNGLMRFAAHPQCERDREKDDFVSVTVFIILPLCEFTSLRLAPHCPQGATAPPANINLLQIPPPNALSCIVLVSYSGPVMAERSRWRRNDEEKENDKIQVKEKTELQSVPSPLVDTSSSPLVVSVARNQSHPVSGCRRPIPLRSKRYLDLSDTQRIDFFGQRGIELN
ncbi:hypothetical protein ACLOJK_013830 [Asimina triloba]